MSTAPIQREMESIDRQRRCKAGALDVLNAHPFVAPAWLRNAHAQTLWAPFFRRPPRLPRRVRRLETPDGDFLDLYIVDGDREKPAVLLLHGLEGSAESSYIRGMEAKLNRLRWTAVTMEFRGCGRDMNRARRLYHSGETTDLALAAHTIATEYARMYLAGFSLGGNMLVKWLGESPRCAPVNVIAAAAISVPYDLTVSGPHIDRVLGGLYSRHFLRSLIKKARRKEAQHPRCIDMARVARARTLYEFDNRATAVLHGFRDVDHYYETQRSGRYLDGVCVPLLMLSAADDPFNPASTLPREAAARSPYLHGEFTEHGGHVGFVCGLPHRAIYWAEEQVMRFFGFYDVVAKGDQ